MRTGAVVRIIPIIAVVVPIFSGCVSQQAIRDSLQVSEQQIRQSAIELSEIIELKDKDLKTWGPVYVEAEGGTDSDWNQMSADTDSTTFEALKHLNALNRTADHLSMLDSTIEDAWFGY